MFENISFSEIRIINLVLHIQAGTSAKNYVQLIKSFDELTRLNHFAKERVSLGERLTESNQFLFNKVIFSNFFLHMQ